MNRTMYDPKFEKAVRQRMEELEFHPAESVWANIEKAIVVPRRERRVVLFWRFLLPGIMVTAAASIYAFYHFTGHPVRVSGNVVHASGSVVSASGNVVHAVKPVIAGPQA